MGRSRATLLTGAILVGILLGIGTAEALVSALASRVPDEGWRVRYDLGRAENPLVRAVVARAGLGALVGEEALYYTATSDDAGQPLQGQHAYVLHFAAGAMPQVGAFWSLSAYDAEHFLPVNELERYSIGDRSRQLRYNPDGSLDIIVSQRQPAGNSDNWLPAPAGEFSLTFRAYEPGSPLLNGEWLPPLPRRADSNRGKDG